MPGFSKNLWMHQTDENLIYLVKGPHSNRFLLEVAREDPEYLQSLLDSCGPDELDELERSTIRLALKVMEGSR